MQCTWPTLARLAFRGFARPWPLAFPRTMHTRLKTPSKPWTASMSTIRSKTPSPPAQRRAHSTATKLNPLPISFFSTQQTLSTPHPENFTDKLESGLEDKPAYTHAQVGRIAAQAVRLSVHKGNLADAYLIMRSVYHARFSVSNTDTGVRSRPPLAVQRFLGEIESTAIPFDRLVSPRLPAHALLHGLVRIGEYQQAAQLARQMMESGTRVRCTSLEAVMQGLRDMSSASPPGLFAPIISLKAIDTTLFRPHMKANANITESALTILQAARQSGQRSTHRMYRYLMTLCIINGEIILASLLFGVLLRDWQAREQQAKLMHNAALSTHTSEVDTPPPDLADLKRMLSFVSWNLAAPQTDQSSRLAFSASLQALANLADAMDKRQIPINLEPLITALYKCPRTQELVWVPGDSGAPPQMVEAYGYFHAVLDRLILSLADQKGVAKVKEELEAKNEQGLLTKKLNKCEPLNPWAFNALLHYTLRHHHSIDRARVVLVRMLQHPEAGLPTNADVTRNTLERAQRDFPPGAIDRLMRGVGLVPQSPAESFVALARVSDQELDPYALSTQILSLTRSRQISVIIAALRDLLPGLYPPAAPHGTHTIVARKMAVLHREEGLSRAVLLGPVVFGALLNALRKEGKTGLAERVFLHALEAEGKSFVPEARTKGRGTGKLVVRPWCLPVHVYTTMIQVYDRERKGRLDKPFAVGWGLTPDGRQIVYGKNTEPIRRTDLSRRMMVLMYRGMMDASEVIMQRLQALQDHAATTGNFAIEIKAGTLTPPEPDKWFFESLVDIFAKMPHDPVFPAVVKAMVEKGYRVPQSVEHKMKEAWGKEAWDAIVKAREAMPEERVERDRRPIGMERTEKRKGVRMGIPTRMGWKKWNVDRKSLEEKERENMEWSRLLSFRPAKEGMAV